MINIDDLGEFVGIEILRSYCNNKQADDECDVCKIKFLCDCMPVQPYNFNLKYNPSKSNSHEPKNEDTGKLTAKATMKQSGCSIDEAFNLGPLTKEKVKKDGVLSNLSDVKLDSKIVNQIQEGILNGLQDSLSKELKMDIKK